MHQQPPTDPRPRVLHVTQPVDGGVARVVTDLTRAQLAAGWRVTVACPGGTALAATLGALGADVRPWA
ncbi:glycosyltransferase family 1 protein, partial [Streptomyces sp. SID7958]|nr:glycosyltransferase family 1 protein [Streptomyces sp. SID7958]